MKIYALTNIKGGVAKTTDTVNIGLGLAQTGRKVLIIDADHQCNSTLAILGKIEEDTADTFHDVMRKRRPIAEVAIHTPFDNLDLVKGSMWLSNANTALATEYRREYIISDALDGVSNYHYVLIDTSPNTELITVNAWVASDGLIVAMTPSKFAMTGIRILERHISEISTQTRRQYPIFGVVIAMDDHTNKSMTRIHQIREYFGDKVFRTVVPKNVSIEEATDEAVPIFEYAPHSTGANAYATLINEFIQRSEGGSHG